ncbi:rho GTPase-activating protein 7 isoform X2 [Anguilla anguilla]|uniref:rho GTPase-activating protein 7 isoform X2 n=1 Tax=Anguilla anguilla TaxID=7936 RepID=UPI0015AC0EC4|nr:rho GTPase-activating protein 7 isoform X2 [Anguilla anguilla]
MARMAKTPLRRSFSDHVKVSTNKAWDIFWKSAREKRLSEIEAKEACDWLRAAGFPQYVQLFRDSQFPIDIDWVKSDHQFLDKDAVDSLCRRLSTLNRCVEMKLETHRSRRRSEDSEEDEPCAISARWAFERGTRRWSRQEGLEFLPSPDSPSADTPSPREPPFRDEAGSPHSSGESNGGCGTPKTPEDPETSRSSSRSSCQPPSLDGSLSAPPSPGDTPGPGSEERLADRPPRKRGRSLMRKMEKLRLRGGTLRPPSHGNKARVLISGPVLQDGFDEEKLARLRCLDLSELRDGPASPPSSPPRSGSASPSLPSSTVSTPSPVTRVRSHRQRAPPLDQSPTRHTDDQAYQNQNQNQNHRQEHVAFQVPPGHKPGTFPTALTHSVLCPIDNTSVNWRTGSFHGYRGRQCLSSGSKERGLVCSPLASPTDKRGSVYDNVPGGPAHGRTVSDPPVWTGRGGEDADADDDVFSALDSVMERISGLQQLVTAWSEKLSDDGDSDSAHTGSGSSPCPPSPRDIHLEIEKHRGAGSTPPDGDRENCDQTPEESEPEPEPASEHYSGERPSPQHRRLGRLHWTSEQELHPDPPTTGIEGQPAVHINLLQKLSLLRLTALMDKFSPSSKQGWSWTVPKTMRKTRAPESWDGRVFGVPLLQSVQQTGYPLPPGILKALHYLRAEGLDQVGLFRKSGVKSRIQALREMVEADPAGVSYEGQSAYDVADMVKQYFRDLPEPIFSSKLCESFLHIYQYFPKDQQFAGVQAAIFLLPDENREALQTLLLFLRDVVACAKENQMTPTNVAVCLAPSLFHLNSLKRDSTTSRSSHRKHSLGRPDQRDLSENLAATQGLAHLVAESAHLFQVPRDWLMQNQGILGDEVLQPGDGWHFPPDLSEAEQDQREALDLCVQDVLREAREGFRGWAPFSSPNSVDLAFRKEEDGLPLRSWKAVVEVEAPVEEALHLLLREQQVWEEELQHCGVIERLGEDTEVYRYTLQGVGARPPLDHVLLRTWQRDPSSGATVLAAASTEHPDAPPRGVRAQVLTCVHLLEPLGTGRARLTHVCRTDTRGRSPDWYNRVAGYLLALKLGKVRDSFRPDVKEMKI